MIAKIKNISLAQLRQMRDAACKWMATEIEQMCDEDGDEITEHGGERFLEEICSMHKNWLSRWEMIFEFLNKCEGSQIEPESWRDLRQMIERINELEKGEIARLKSAA